MASAKTGFIPRWRFTPSRLHISMCEVILNAHHTSMREEGSVPRWVKRVRHDPATSHLIPLYFTSTCSS